MVYIQMYISYSYTQSNNNFFNSTNITTCYTKIDVLLIKDLLAIIVHSKYFYYYKLFTKLAVIEQATYWIKLLSLKDIVRTMGNVSHHDLPFRDLFVSTIVSITSSIANTVDDASIIIAVSVLPIWLTLRKPPSWIVEAGCGLTVVVG